MKEEQMNQGHTSTFVLKLTQMHEHKQLMISRPIYLWILYTTGDAQQQQQQHQKQQHQSQQKLNLPDKRNKEQ